PIRAASPPGYPRIIHDLSNQLPQTYRPLSAPATPEPPSDLYPASLTYKIELVNHDDPVLEDRMLKAAYDQVLPGTSRRRVHTPTAVLYISHKIFLLIAQTTRLAMDAHDREEAGSTTRSFFTDLPGIYYPADGFAVPEGQPPDSDMRLKLPVRAASPPGFTRSIHDLYEEAPHMYRPLSAPATPDPPTLEYPESCTYVIDLISNFDPRLGGAKMKASHYPLAGSDFSPRSTDDFTPRMFVARSLFAQLAYAAHHAVEERARTKDYDDTLDLHDVEMEEPSLQGPPRVNALVLPSPPPLALSGPPSIFQLPNGLDPSVSQDIARHLERLRLAEGHSVNDRPPTPHPQALQGAIAHRLAQFPPGHALLTGPGMPFYRCDGYIVPIGEPPASSQRIKVPMRLRTPEGYRNTIHALSRMDPTLFRPLSAPSTPEPPTDDYPNSRLYNLILSAPEDPNEHPFPFSVEFSPPPSPKPHAASRVIQETDPFLWMDEALFDYLDMTFPLPRHWTRRLNSPDVCSPGPDEGDSSALPNVDEEMLLAEYDRLRINDPDPVNHLSDDRRKATPTDAEYVISSWIPTDIAYPDSCKKLSDSDLSYSDSSSSSSSISFAAPRRSLANILRSVNNRMAHLGEAMQFTVAAVATLLSSHAAFYRAAQNNHFDLETNLTSIYDTVETAARTIRETDTDHQMSMDRIARDLLDLQLDIGAIRTNVEAWNWTPEDADEADGKELSPLSPSPDTSSDMELSAADFNDVQP
ncbi:hypothetical protein PUNSTDRAFT_130923, partial [Punctularia strigosozonata HHB-11173 SS5]|uniref:uncharacterized protein n=1 Tax=Punctularia strigosozonata (strain HHB-11173) TaxID=741275 RepID=UPI0004416E3C